MTYSATDMRTSAVDELYSVTGRADGAEEGVPTGGMYLTSSDYEIMHARLNAVLALTACLHPLRMR